MPTTRTGRQSSPAKEEDSPSKLRVQPVRGARLRSASPFFDAASASTSISASQSSQTSSPPKASPSKASASRVSPSKSTRASPRKKAAVVSTSLQPPTPRRSTRSRSRSVDPDIPFGSDHDSSRPPTRDVSEALDSKMEVVQSNTVRLDRAVTSHDDDIEDPAATLPAIAEEEAAVIAELDKAASSSSSSSESASDSDSDSGSDASSSPDSEDTSSDDEQEGDPATDLDTLLKASQTAYKSRASAPATHSRFEDNQDTISFDSVADSASSTKRSGKNMSLVVKAKHQIAKTSPPSDKPSSSKDKLDKQIEAFDEGFLVPDKKKSKHARTVQTSAGSSWFDMPEFGASASRLASLKKHSAADKGHARATGGDARLTSAEQLRREVQALRLRNALDPKRFYRGSAKNQTMPKFAQLGKIIASPLEPKAVMSRQERGRTVVEELIRDAEAASYAKRKFAESQASHKSNYNGRRKPPSKKKRT
ncbi:uncharacterized protein MEPE_01181 [Melanopsichium pennsylvanicum]|uniref:Fcf2 pre-rRNA processing C-terminal domain-containing protein n=2 Tax=Melanopsichium pennsylvanicum TaxID=63383 RepID=A0AAJ4XHB4_9BASI|nr:hypothetical protein BN887_00691 [Melanopsichium pennsylvanicum 4]SNX82475.1 uncharacterized protein MEPE_01181 [Melanopsichium pennsylvanicum]